MSTIERRCRRCRQPIRAGQTEPPRIDVETDVAALGPLGELEALTTGRATYAHHVRPDRLTHRTGRAIRTAPAGTVAGIDVLPAHRCTPTPTPTPTPFDRPGG